MRHIDMIVIHCSASEEGRSYTVEQITKDHIARGFRTVGYHFVVYADGTIKRGRKLSEIGAHAKGYNRRSVGICYIGGLKDGKPEDTRTVAQVYALRALVESMKSMFENDWEIPLKIVGHRDLSVDLNGDGVISKGEWMKECPCFDVNNAL